MVGLFTHLDGLAAVLFHVEQQPGTAWHYRFRLTGDLPAPYLAWQEFTVSGKFATFHPQAACPIEVQWRATSEEDWQDPTHCDLTRGRCRFTVKPLVDCSFIDGFTAVAPVREEFVAAYQFPPLFLRQGEERSIEALADAPALGNILLLTGDFAPVSKSVSIVNEGPSIDSWKIAASAPPLVTLTRSAEICSRAWIARGIGTVEPALVSQYLAENPITDS